MYDFTQKSDENFCPLWISFFCPSDGFSFKMTSTDYFVHPYDMRVSLLSAHRFLKHLFYVPSEYLHHIYLIYNITLRIEKIHIKDLRS